MGKKVLSGSMSRRDVFKLGSLAAVGVAGASMLGGCAPQRAGIFPRLRPGRGRLQRAKTPVGCRLSW